MKKVIFALVLVGAGLQLQGQLVHDAGLTSWGFPYTRISEASGLTSFNSEIDRVNASGGVFRVGSARYVVVNPFSLQTNTFTLESGLSANMYEYARPFKDSMLYWRGNAFYLKSITTNAPARLYWSLATALPGQTISDKPMQGDGNEIEYNAAGDAIFAITTLSGQGYVLNLTRKTVISGPFALPVGVDYGSVAPGGDHLYFVLQGDRGAPDPGTWAYTLQGTPAGKIMTYASHTDLTQVTSGGKSCIGAIWRGANNDTAHRANVYMALYQYIPATGTTPARIVTQPSVLIKNNKSIPAAEFPPACAMSQIHASHGSGYMAYVTSNTEYCTSPPVRSENVNILYVIPTHPLGPAIPIAYTSQRPTSGGSTKDQPEVWVHRLSETQLAVFLRTNRSTTNDLFVITYQIPQLPPPPPTPVDPLAAARDSVRMLMAALTQTEAALQVAETVVAGQADSIVSLKTTLDGSRVAIETMEGTLASQKAVIAQLAATQAELMDSLAAAQASADLLTTTLSATRSELSWTQGTLLDLLNAMDAMEADTRQRIGVRAPLPAPSGFSLNP
ncbi:MAG: hypothetical protein SF053_21645 [Bacteroidia bacterium]|nr:hypothetical protein [Bacteroidia bacterium]